MPFPSFEIVRDPLWNNIRVDTFTMRLVDSRVVQRLRYVRQLGLAYLVYPGATHSRFEHALGTYHLARRTLALLAERDSRVLQGDDAAITCAAAVLHDVGHYPFSHALEEIGAPNHEDIAAPLVTEGEVADILASELGAASPGRVLDLIRGRSPSALQGLISGSLDLDKIEYLKRDALMCGVPYGEIDVDRLTHSLVLVPDPDTGAPTVGVVEKGLAALESLLFAKYQMYRNVYWHHAVRSATAMYKRLVSDALQPGCSEPRASSDSRTRGCWIIWRGTHRPPCSMRCVTGSCTSGPSNPGGGAAGWSGRVDCDAIGTRVRGRRPAGRSPGAVTRRAATRLPGQDANVGFGYPGSTTFRARATPDGRGPGRVDQPSVPFERALSVRTVAARLHRSTHVGPRGQCNGDRAIGGVTPSSVRRQCLQSVSPLLSVLLLSRRLSARPLTPGC